MVAAAVADATAGCCFGVCERTGRAAHAPSVWRTTSSIAAVAITTRFDTPRPRLISAPLIAVPPDADVLLRDGGHGDAPASTGTRCALSGNRRPSRSSGRPTGWPARPAPACTA